MNPLTWPEILRQLGLSSGFGPRLKKCNSRVTHTGEKDEVLIRSGSAAGGFNFFLKHCFGLIVFAG